MEQAILAFLSGATDPYLFRAADKNALGRRTIDSTSNLTFAKVLQLLQKFDRWFTYLISSPQNC
jgi:hypothetical protein